MQYTHINVHFSLRYRRIISLTAFGVSFVTSYTRVTHDAIYNLRNACNLNSSTKVCALSERQMQFWEDVDDGLKNISRYHETSSTGLSMDRIKTFAKTARGEISIPQPSVVGHQPSEEYVHGLTAKPFWDARGDSAQFPWAEKLEDQSHIIIEELEAKLARDQAGNSLFAGDSSLQNQVMGSGWSAYRLQRLGVWNAENCKEFPRTYNLLQSLEIPLAVRGVCFAKQGPQVSKRRAEIFHSPVVGNINHRSVFGSQKNIYYMFGLFLSFLSLVVWCATPLRWSKLHLNIAFRSENS